MLLADLGADVVMINGGRAGQALPDLSRGKRLITLDLKSQPGRDALHHLVDQADVLIEGFRPGVAERIGAGWEELHKRNPRLVYCSLTGYGPSGPMATSAGHDINYLAITGLLGAMGPIDDVPVPPLNLAADLGGGGLLAAFGIMSALYARAANGVGRRVDAAMIDGVMSMMASWYTSWGTAVLPSRGAGLTAGEAPFYRCYPCSDGGLVAIGAIEPAFFASLWRVLELVGEPPNHLDPTTWSELETTIGGRLAELTRDE